jgi:hypothetical protein
MAIGGGIEQRGKTRGKQLGVDGADVAIQRGPCGGSGGGGKKNSDMKKGRNAAKIIAQKGS